MRAEHPVGTVDRVKDRASLLDRARRTPAWRLDAVIAVLFAVTVLLTAVRGEGEGSRGPDALGVVLILVATLPYFFRRAAPFLVLVVSVTAAAGLFIAGYDPGPLPFLIAIGTYTVGAYCPLRQVVIATAVVELALVVMVVAASTHFGAPEFLTTVPVYIATVLVGWSMQSRRLRTEALEREHSEAAARAAADERLRIAQELHDVIGHSLGVIAVQAGVGMHLIDSDPDEAKRALEHISRTSRSSLAEIRRLLGMVRTGEDGAVYAPTPGLADLPRLVEDVQTAGLPVALTVSPDARELPPGVELAAYRIVQEALTNARKHAHARHATVSLDVDAGTLHVTVTDDGTGAESNGTGHGLVGMQERVAVYGGTLEVGPAPTGGYRVSAAIPFEEPA